ncbi:MAG: hypothetical protein WC347_13090 [Smithellaceae bacterium]|jgi:predicted secreted protein
MKEIELTKKATVPDGKYCVDYNSQLRVEQCKQLRSETRYIRYGWEAGLGSPGYMIWYHCAFFDEDIMACYPIEGVYGLTVEKCQQCLTASE